MTIDELIETGKKPATPEEVKAFQERVVAREKEFVRISKIDTEFYQRSYGCYPYSR